MFKYLFFLTAACVSGPAFAQDSAPDDSCPGCDEVVIADLRAETITVTANGLGSPIGETGQAVTVIELADIETIQGSDPLRVLQRVPGAVFSRNGGLGSFTAVRLRGAEAEQVLVLIDGVRVADQAAPGGGYDFGNLALGTVERMDVLRGANSTIWGSDAIGGVVALTTASVTGMEGTLEAGSRGTLAANLEAGVEASGSFVGISGGWVSTDGYSAAAKGTEADGFRQFAVSAKGHGKLTDTLALFGHANWREGRLDIDGYPAPDYALADTLETQETRQVSGAAGLRYENEALTLRGAYSIADTRRANFADDRTASFDSVGHEEAVEVRGEYRFAGALQLYFGGENAWSSYAVSYDAPARAMRTGGYLQLGWQGQPLSAHLGARVEDHQGFGTATSFGGDVTYALRPDLRLRASLGEGFKAPTLYQLFSFYGTPTLRPEESLGGDLGLEYGSRDYGFRFALTAFRRDSRNLINFAFDDPARPYGAYANTAQARAQGVEAEAGAHVTPELVLGGVYSLTHARDRDSGRDLARRPRHAATLFADWDNEAISLGADLRLASASWDDSFNTSRLDGYATLDVRAAVAVSEKVEVFGRVENVFAADYQTAKGYAAPPRGVFAGVRARL